ncbi:MAG: MBOAT family protein [Myxococcales bacterium]|nr:MBOAT family protein [Myxococcales bacterium]
MLFNSFEFFLFLVPVLCAYALLNHRWQNRFLLVASYVFYGAWNWKFLGLIAFSTCLDYGCGIKLAAPDTKRRKPYLWLSLAGNLGLLATFKYFNFFAQSMQSLLGQAGVEVGIPTLAVILPVGISFYTFQTLSYTLDVHARRTEPCKNFIDFALFVSFFPQLVAGPIEKSRRFLPQIRAPRQLTVRGFDEGCTLIFWGLFKKVFVADNCALIVDQIFRGGGEPTGFQYLIGSWAFAWQIYCDFSGYTDIARGVAKLMGFDLMLNFNMPYFARNISDFWRRWHISLSTWFKEYLYIPLGGSRVSKPRLAMNLMVVFVVSGLWHGAATNFVVWGAMHGVGLVVVTLAGPHIDKFAARLPPRLWTVMAVLLTFHFATFTFAIWQTPTAGAWLDAMGAILTKFDFQTRHFGTLGKLSGYVAIPIVVQYLQKKHEDPAYLYTRLSKRAKVSFYLLLLLLLVRFGVFEGDEFIYFQF